MTLPTSQRRIFINGIGLSFSLIVNSSGVRRDLAVHLEVTGRLAAKPASFDLCYWVSGELGVTRSLRDTRPNQAQDIPGSSAIYLYICPSVTLFEFSSRTPISEDIKQKFDPAARLDLQLNKSPAVLVFTAVGERVIAARPRSGRVSDTIYRLSLATALSIFIEDTK
ncbi:hypothetical protein F53441_11786 [Fusarium austroafricanum]|uniref:Uncharacterized protein n=1 Tax=Fusarium austroafricanum TaxID=2364996 RepID=A0A8H4K413_9HYPO|nr:hypothetical protein F53441_11786 [Fusarium austroafricanum]